MVINDHAAKTKIHSNMTSGKEDKAQTSTFNNITVKPYNKLIFKRAILTIYLHCCA